MHSHPTVGPSFLHTDKPFGLAHVDGHANGLAFITAFGSPLQVAFASVKKYISCDYDLLKIDGVSLNYFIFILVEQRYMTPLLNFLSRH